jgi:hypothetical protein
MAEENAAVVTPNDGPDPSEKNHAKESVVEAQAEKQEPAGEADPQANANEAGEKEDGKEPEQKRKPGSVRQRERAQRLAEDNARLRQENERLKAPPPAEPKPKPTRPKPEDFRIGDTDQFDAVKFEEAREKYEDEVIDWKVEQRESEREKKRAENERQQAERAERSKAEKEFSEKYEARRAKAAESMADFEEKADECIATLEELVPDPIHTDPSTFQKALAAHPGIGALVTAIREQDEDGKLEYHLGSHPEEIERIAKLAPAAAGIALGKLFAQLAQEPEPDEEADAEPAAPSKAPPPLTPNRKSAAPVQVMPGQPGADKLPTDEWMARRRKQRQAKQNFAPKR